MVQANDTIRGKATTAFKQNLLDSVKKAPTKETQGLPYKLPLSVGIKYMMTINVDVEDGLVNGAVGVLKDYEQNKKGNTYRLWVAFPDDTIRLKHRREITKKR